MMVSTAVATGETPQQSAKNGKRSTAPVTLIGCVVPDPTKPGAFTLSDVELDTRYRLTGTNVRDYAGQLVRVSGAVPKRLKIVGGLYPSPNVAAQAGTMDPTKAAIAAAEPGPAGITTLSEFRVRSVQAIPGSCPLE